jgi:hypothetical protein
MNMPAIDAVISTTDMKEIMAAFEIVEEKLPFLIGLTPMERRQLTKIGRKSQTFVIQALDMAEQHSELMPRCLDVEEARRDMELFEALNPLLQKLSRLRELVEDTQMVVGSEAYAAARLAYSSAKTSGKGMGLDEVVSDLSQQFRKTRKAQTTEK